MQPKPPAQRSRSAGKGGTRGGHGSLKGLGLVFLMGLYHEVSQAHANDERPHDLKELLQILADHPEQLQPLIDLLVESYPELADQLLAADGETGAGPLNLDMPALADQLLDLEATGYLQHEEAERLLASLRALDVLLQGGADDDLQLAQADAGTASDAAASAPGGAEGAAAAGGEAAIETLPAPAAGPAALALGPFLGFSGVGAVAASSIYATSGPSDTTPPAALTLTLAADTGASSTDGITSNGRMDIAGLETGASWQYSTDGGAHWTQGTGTSFTLVSNATYAAGLVQVRQMDAAGNTGAVTSTAAAITVDTIAPQVQSLTQASATQLVLNYDGTLDAAHPPPASAYTVTVNGVVDTVNSVSVSGAGVTLNLATALTTGQSVVVQYTDPAGDTANAVQDAAGNDAVTITTGKVADGYVRGAQIYVDGYNGGTVNGQPDAAEALPGVVTDANGNFFLPDGISGAILAKGGVDIATGQPNTMVLKAPSGSTMISPLTTLVQAYAEANGVSATDANVAVLDALGLDNTLDLRTYDPLTVLSGGTDATALAVQKAAVQVATVVQAAAAAPAGSNTADTVGSTVIANLVQQIETALAGSSTVDLGNTTTLTTILGTVTTATVTSIETATDAIAAAATLDQVVNAQAAVLDTINPAAPTGITLLAASDSGVSGDNLTNITSPFVRVALNVTATDGSAAVAGNTVTVFHGATNVGMAVLTAGNISSGYVDVALAGLAANTVNGLSATVTDAASHASTASPTYSLTIDTALPVAPAFVLALDDGVLPDDGISGGGAINVSGLETGASWQYSVDSGSHWTTGAGTSFVLPDNDFYAAGSVLVRQTDAAGNAGPTATNAADMVILHNGAVTLTDAEASALVTAGLEFAASDTGVTVQGTQLHTSLSGLQALGVDVISITAATGQTVLDLGSGAVDFGHLPTVSSTGASIGLGIQASDAASLTTDNAAALHAAGFSFVDVAGNAITLTDAQATAIVNAGLSFAPDDTAVALGITANAWDGVSASDLATHTTALASHGVDLIDVTGNVIDITDAQAGALVSAGLHFAADDTGVSVHAAGTHLSTTLADLQHLGVDYVHTGAGTDTVVLDASTGPIPSIAPLPVFDAEDQVTLKVQDNQVADMATFIHNYNTTISIDPHIDDLRVVLHDALGVELGGQGVLDPNFAGMGIELEVSNSTLPEVTLGMILEAADGSADPLAALTGGTLRNALQSAGIVDIHIDSGTTFSVADTDLKPLMDAGLISADGGAEVKVTNADGTLDVTLAQLAAIGADQVQVPGHSSVAVDAGVTFTDATGLENALTTLLTTYEAQAGGHPVSNVFTAGDAVTLKVAGTVGGSLPTDYHLTPALVDKLVLLGIDDVIDDHGHSIK